MHVDVRAFSCVFGTLLLCLLCWEQRDTRKRFANFRTWTNPVHSSISLLLSLSQATPLLQQGNQHKCTNGIVVMLGMSQNEESRRTLFQTKRRYQTHLSLTYFRFPNELTHSKPRAYSASGFSSHTHAHTKPSLLSRLFSLRPLSLLSPSPS